MTRQREIPSVQNRFANQIIMTFPIRKGVAKLKVSGAANINDAYGAVGGVGGSGTLPMFEVQSGATFVSKSLRARRLPFIEDTNRGLTRMCFDIDDFATPVNPAGYIPNDDQTLFIRLSLFNDASNSYMSEGPIMVIPPYDFYTTKGPIFTLTGVAPDLAIGTYPPNIPDVLLPTAMNFLLPSYMSTVSVANLDDPTTGSPLFFSFHPGMPPSVLYPGQDVTLTGGGAPEMFFASPNGNPPFTVRASAINSA